MTTISHEVGGCQTSKQCLQCAAGYSAVIACIYAQVRLAAIARVHLLSVIGPTQTDEKPLSANVIGLHILQRLLCEGTCVKWPEVATNCYLSWVAIAIHIGYDSS